MKWIRFLLLGTLITAAFNQPSRERERAGTGLATSVRGQLRAATILPGAELMLARLRSRLESDLSEFYKKVGRVSWVVRDLEKVKAGWNKLGFPPAFEHGEVQLDNLEVRGRAAAAAVLVASTRLGDVDIDWIQPLSGSSAYSEFLEKHGDGVFSLVHQVPTAAALTFEVERLSRAGVGVLQSQSIETGDGAIRLIYLDSRPQGKYSLGLIQYPGAPFVTPGPGHGKIPFDKKMSQFAFVVRDPKPVSDFWKKLGFPELSITHSQGSDRIYRGNPGQFDHQLGWQRHGTVVYEWCIPLQGPTAYNEHLQAHGEGFHHFGFQVDDIDAVVAEWTRLGFPPIQSGAWGEAGKKGSGRFAYMDTDSIGGVTLELLWSQK